MSVFFDNINLTNMDYYGIINTFNVPQKLFTQENAIKQLNYFNLEINLQYKKDRNDNESVLVPSFDFDHFSECNCEKIRFIELKYMFTKTKNKKFLFESNFNNHIIANVTKYSLAYKQQRICDNRNYNNYYFIDRNINISIHEIDIRCGCHNCFKDTEFDKIKFSNEDLNVNSFIIEGRYFIPDAEHFLDIISKNNNNMLENFEYYGNNFETMLNYLPKLQKCKKLKILKIFLCSSFYYMEIAFVYMFRIYLSEFKYLALLEIHEYKGKIQLREKAKEEIASLFPGLIFIQHGLEQTIKWQKI